MHCHSPLRNQIKRRLERSNELRAQSADPDMLNCNGKLLCIAYPEYVSVSETCLIDTLFVHSTLELK